MIDFVSKLERKNMLKYALLVAATMMLPGFVFAEDTKAGVIQLSGTGVVKVAPDEGYITVGVVTTKAKSAEAVRENSAVVEKLFKTLKDKGVTKENFKTVEFSLHENVKSVTVVEEGQKVQKYVKDGFVVTNRLQITICELDKFGSVLDALVSDGANTVESISFGSSKAKEKLNEARKLATKEALAKAKLYADALGVTLGNVMDVTESEYRPQPRAMYQMRGESAMADQVPVSGGTLSFNITVHVKWELKPVAK